MRVRAAKQHGLVGWYQLASMGCGREQLRHLVRRGRLERLSRSVFRVAGSPDTLQQRRMAAVLDVAPGAGLSHDAAAAAWGVGNDGHPRLQVVRERRGSAPRVSLARVHEVRDLLPHHLVLLDGVPVTTPARTVVDLAATTHPERVARILDAAWSRRLLGIGEVANIVAEVRGRGRAGVVLLDQLIDERRGTVRPGSALEIRFEQMLARGGFPPLRRQVDIVDDEGWIACVDYVVEGLPLILFVDGGLVHTSVTDRRHDDRQTARLRAAGYVVERFSDAAILYDEPAVLRRAHAALVLARDSGVLAPESRARTEPPARTEGGAAA